MSIRARLGCALLASCFCAGMASGQQPGPRAEAGAGTINLDVVVTPKSGPPVGDLQQSDFTLLDNKAPQTITSFKVVDAREAPIEVVIVLDAVNDSAQNLGYERTEIDKFLEADGGNLAHPVAIDVVTDTGIQSVASSSSDGNALSAALQKSDIGLRDIGRAAGYWGATERLQISLKALGQLLASEAARPGRKLVLWVSPGWPLLSGPGLQLDAKDQQQLFSNIVGISTDLLRASITLYSIDPLGAGESTLRTSDYEMFLKGVSKPDRALPGDLGLEVIATQSGGLVLNSGNDLVKFLNECVSDSAPYYEISFAAATPEKPNEYHQLGIKIARPGLTARTREGYYAQPPSAPGN
ncbi:MAG: VWA domain-containing protein [Candidatus Acidiferrales bacterium]